MRYRLGDITIKHWNDWDRVPRVDAFILFGGNILAAPTAFQVFAAQAISYLAVTAVTSWALRALAPKPDFGSSRGLLVNAREATAPQQIVYGEIRKGGTVTFIESTGDTNQYLHQVIVLAGHEVNSIGDIYINDEVVTLDGSGFVTDAKWNSKIRIKKHTGADNQTADSDLVSETSVTSDFKGEGIAYIYVRMEYDQDVFAEGVPLFTAKVQGKKVYDPRTSTTAYSANAALCIRDYLVSAYGLDNSGDVNDAYFQAAANTCDESVTLAGSGTESRYEINGIISLDQTPSDILGDMMTACAGTLFWGQGEWHLKVGEYTSSIKTFTLDDLRGPINLDTKHSRRDNFNIVRGTFNDADQGYIRADYPEIRSSTFITNDGGVENALDLALPLTTSAATAQRLAKMTLFRAREEMTFTADFGLEAFEVECGDIIALTIDRYGWTAKEFEVVGWKFRNDGDAGDLRVALTLRETSAAAFSWSAEESDITSNDSTLTNAGANLSVSNVTVTDKGNIQQDGTFVGQALVSWTAATNKFLEHYEVQWKDVDETVYQRTQISADNTSVTIGPLETGTQYNVRVRGMTVSGIRGSFVAASPYTHGGDSTAPSPVTGLSATGGPKIVTLDWTAPTTDSDTSTLYDLKGYNVYRNTSNSQPATPIAFSGSDKYVDGGLAASTTYYYWVTAVDFTGNESTAVASGSVTTDAPVSGVDSDTRIYTGKVYYQTLQASSPSTPSASSFSESTLSFSGLTSGWAETQPRVDATSTTVKEWSSKYKVEYDADDNETITFSTPDGAFQITDDLESDNYVSGSSGWRIERDTGNAEFQNAIIRGTLNANDITAGTISAARIPTLSTAKFDIFTGDTIGINKGTDSPVNTGDVASVSFTPTSASTCIVQVSASITCPNAASDSTYAVGFEIDVNGTKYSTGSTGTVFDGGNINPKPLSIAYGFSASANTTYTIKCTFTQPYGRSKQVTATSGALTAIFTQA